jgi:DNA-nicking Smr family endonuclease
LSGNKAAARAFSLSAQKLNDEVMELHNQAASKIFAERNSNLGSSKGEVMIDLHGLHPLEAVDKLNEAIHRLTNSKYKGRVIIVTGTGHHSRGKSKVLPVVREHLQKNGWRPQDGSLEDGMGGILIIKI